MKITIDPAAPFSGIYPDGSKTPLRLLEEEMGMSLSQMIQRGLAKVHGLPAGMTLKQFRELHGRDAEVTVEVKHE